MACSWATLMRKVGGSVWGTAVCCKGVGGMRLGVEKYGAEKGIETPSNSVEIRMISPEVMPEAGGGEG